MNRRILFGNDALIIENDFKEVSSRIGNLQNPNSKFIFSDELM